jgi:hypothetical protein
LTVTGPGAGSLAISGGGLSRILNVDDGVGGPTIDVEIVGLTLTGGAAVDNGGAIRSVENVTVTEAVISGSSAVIEGGGIFHDGSGTLIVTASLLSGNFAGDTGSNGGGTSGTGGGGGGGIANAGSGAVTITNSTLSDNSTGEFGDGGGIFNWVGTVTLTNSFLSENSAEFGGSIISFDDGAVTVTNSTLSDNSASDAGGAIANGDGTVTVTGSTLSGNSADKAGGGGIYSFIGGTVTVTNSTLSGNSAGSVSGDHDGGGIVNDGGTLTVTNSTLSGNSATGDGGGIMIFAGGTATVTNSTLSGNAASDQGGGIFNAFNSTVILNNTIVANSGSGGQIVNDNVSVGALSGSHNLIEGESPVGLVGTITADPKLGPLQINGGPTKTHRLLLGSPAIDAGSNALVPGGVTTDQRGTGFDRIVDGDDNGTAIVDIGAYEFHSPREQVAELDEFIDELVANGSLNQGQGNALTKKKENALRKIENGQINAAINELNAFINQVQAFIKTGKLTASEGATLLAGVNELLATITP